MEYAREQAPDLLLLTGDVLNYEHEAGRRYVKEYIKDYHGNWMFVPGNHDNEEMPKYLTMDEVQVRELEGVRVIGLDSSKRTLSDENLKKLEQSLADEKPSILVMHVPVGTDYNEETMSIYNEYFVINKKTTDENGQRLTALCEDTKTPIVAVLCGHVHGYQKSELIPGRVQICCSSGLIGFMNRIVIHG